MGKSKSIKIALGVAIVLKLGAIAWGGPGNLKEVQFQIFDPSGNLISASADNGTLAVQITDGDHTVARASNSSTGQTYKQAEMTFLPKKKLVKGIYRIEVLSENLTVGSLQMRLR